MNIQKDLSCSQFLALLLLYCSYADFKPDKEEIKYIKEKISNDEYKTINGYFNKTSDYEVIQTILKYREKYFLIEEKTKKLFSEMKNLFLCDKEYSEFEQCIYNALTALFKGTEK